MSGFREMSGLTDRTYFKVPFCLTTKVQQLTQHRLLKAVKVANFFITHIIALLKKTTFGLFQFSQVLDCMTSKL